MVTYQGIIMAIVLLLLTRSIPNGKKIESRTKERGALEMH